MRTYISHPIAGMSEAQKADSEARGAEFVQRHLGGIAVLPRLIPAACEQGYGDRSVPEGMCGLPGKVIPGNPHSVQCYMRGDIMELLTCSAMLVMPGWEASAGCRDEVNVAAMCGIPILFYTEVSRGTGNIGGRQLRA